MIERIELFFRLVKGSKLTWQEVDTNWSRIKEAINYLLLSNYVHEAEAVGEGEYTLTHDFGLVPHSVKVWQNVDTDKWIQIEPQIMYKDADLTAKLYINFNAAPGKIKVNIKF